MIISNSDLNDKCNYICSSYSKESRIVNDIKEVLEYIINSKITINSSITIEPLFIEAYIASNTENAKTTNNPCHGNDKQLNRYLKLYYHSKGRGGVDLVLSTKDNIYFAILLKCCKIDNIIYSQIGVKNKLRNELNVNENVKCELEYIGNRNVGYCARINVNGNPNELALYINDRNILGSAQTPNGIYKRLRN